MKIKSKLIARVIIGKAIGAIFGGIAFFLIPILFIDANLFLRFGVWLWYISLGAFIGVFGVITYHPFLKLSFPFWIRGTLLGGWMNFVLILLAYDTLIVMMSNTILEGYSPFIFVIEGMIFGLLTDYIAFKIVGEGDCLVN